MKKASRIVFKDYGNEYVARNGRIEEYAIGILERDYPQIIFENDEINNEANMSWPEFLDKSILMRAKADFENYIVKA